MKRRLMLAGALSAPWWITACAGDPAPPIRWYELRSEPPAERPTPNPGDGAVWELAGTVAIPGALDRDALVVASGAAGVRPLVGHRWAEPLRESIPRVLAADLALLRGQGLVWRSPAPAGVGVQRRVRVEIVTLLADDALRTLRLQARWWFVEAAEGAPPPVPAVVDLAVPVGDGSADALAAAHRAALWQLAERMVLSQTR